MTIDDKKLCGWNNHTHITLSSWTLVVWKGVSGFQPRCQDWIFAWKNGKFIFLFGFHDHFILVQIVCSIFKVNKGQSCLWLVCFAPSHFKGSIDTSCSQRNQRQPGHLKIGQSEIWFPFITLILPESSHVVSPCLKTWMWLSQQAYCSLYISSHKLL